MANAMMLLILIIMATVVGKHFAIGYTSIGTTSSDEDTESQELVPIRDKTVSFYPNEMFHMLSSRAGMREGVDPTADGAAIDNSDSPTVSSVAVSKVSRLNDIDDLMNDQSELPSPDPVSKFSQNSNPGIQESSNIMAGAMGYSNRARASDGAFQGNLDDATRTDADMVSNPGFATMSEDENNGDNQPMNGDNPPMNRPNMATNEGNLATSPLGNPAVAAMFNPTMVGAANMSPSPFRRAGMNRGPNKRAHRKHNRHKAVRNLMIGAQRSNFESKLGNIGNQDDETVNNLINSFQQDDATGKIVHSGLFNAQTYGLMKNG